MLVKNNFTIPDKISYIQFMLSGAGAGEFGFDDVKFEKTLYINPDSVPSY